MARRGGDALTLLLAAACSPIAHPTTEIPEDFVDRYAAARCGAVTRCTCEPVGWIDEGMCIEAMHAQLDETVARLREQDVAFDAECFADLVAFWDAEDACDATAAVPYCAIVHGDGVVGDPCASSSTHGFSASSCAEGTYCGAEATCSEAGPSIELQLGEPCLHAQYACVDETYCDGESGTCVTRIPAGEQCVEVHACAASTWCADYGPDGPGTCAPRVGEGEACDSTSAWDARPCLPTDGESRYCVDGTCTFAVAAACGPWL